MKRLLLLMAILFILGACGNGNEDAAETEDTATEDSADETSNEEENGSNEEASGSSADASDIIEEAKSRWGDETSYEARQTSTVSSGDTQFVVRTITTRSDQNEIKVEMDDGEEIKTHYIVDGDHFIYQSGETVQQDDTRDIENSGYGDLISQLDAFGEGEATEMESGYEVQYVLDEPGDLEPFLTDEMTDGLELDALNGLAMVQFDEEYRYTGAELTLTVEQDDAEINISSNITMDRIGEIELLEKPKDM